MQPRATTRTCGYASPVCLHFTSSSLYQWLPFRLAWAFITEHERWEFFVFPISFIGCLCILLGKNNWQTAKKIETFGAQTVNTSHVANNYILTYIFKAPTAVAFFLQIALIVGGSGILMSILTGVMGNFATDAMKSLFGMTP